MKSVGTKTNRGRTGQGALTRHGCPLLSASIASPGVEHLLLNKSLRKGQRPLTLILNKNGMIREVGFEKTFCMFGPTSMQLSDHTGQTAKNGVSESARSKRVGRQELVQGLGRAHKIANLTGGESGRLSWEQKTASTLHPLCLGKLGLSVAWGCCCVHVCGNDLCNVAQKVKGRSRDPNLVKLDFSGG